jgi:hypothetical protein
MHHYTIIIGYIYIHYTYHKMPFLPLTSFLRFHDPPFAKVRGRTKGESDTPPAVAAEASGDSRPGIWNKGIDRQSSQKNIEMFLIPLK